MSDLKGSEAHAAHAAHETPTPEHSLREPTGTLELPNNWRYKRLSFFGIKLPWYASPPVQLLIVALVCFMCPGMFNALNGMGGGGQLDNTANNRANTALYSTFSVVGFFAGTFTNKLGIRTALSFGGIGYSVYVASFLCYNHTHNLGFTTFAGALLGVCAGLLWCAQGAIMMSYPPEASKGRYISWFWMIFNLGAVIGSLVGLRSGFIVDFVLTETDPPRPEHQQQGEQSRQRRYLRRLPHPHPHRRRSVLDSCRCQGCCPP